MDIRGKAALVTGAARGIGRAAAEMLAAAGAATILLVDCDAAALAEVAAHIGRAGTKAQPICTDLADWHAVECLFQDAFGRVGGLDIVLNNAGMMAGPPDFPDTHIASMAQALQVNLLAVMIGNRLVIEHMARRGVGGVVINTASTAAFAPLPADPVYAASKRGMLAFTESCWPAAEQAGVRILAICPGIVDTAIVQHDAVWLQPALAAVEMLTPEHIAGEMRRMIEDDGLVREHVIVNNSIFV